MSLKKIFITIGLVTAVAVLVSMLFLSSSKKKTGSEEQSAKSASQPVSAPAVLPSGTASVKNQENVGKVQKMFENGVQESISEETKKEGLKLISFENQKGSPIPLSDFESATGIKIDSEIQGYLDNGYQTFYCPGPGVKKEFGIFLQYNEDEIYRGFSHDILDMLKDWEDTIHPDLHAVLYPDVNFSESELNQKINFQDGKYRYTEVNLPDGEKSSIQYEAIESGIIIATSLSCLENFHQYNEPNEPYLNP